MAQQRYYVEWDQPVVPAICKTDDPNGLTFGQAQDQIIKNMTDIRDRAQAIINITRDTRARDI